MRAIIRAITVFTVLVVSHIKEMSALPNICLAFIRIHFVLPNLCVRKRSSIEHMSSKEATSIRR